MQSAILIFLATLISVLAIGVQVRALAHRQVGLAIFSAVLVGAGQVVALKLIPGSVSWLDYGALVLANGTGIGLSFLFHSRLSKSHRREPFGFCENADACPITKETCQKSMDCPGLRVLQEGHLQIVFKTKEKQEP